MRVIRDAALAAVVIATTAAAHAQQTPWCTPGHAPDVVRVRLSSACGNPETIEVRRDGDDTKSVIGIRQSDRWWRVDEFPQVSMDTVEFCSKVCGYASVCVAAQPKGQKDSVGNNVCYADYDFRCDEAAWTLAVQAKPAATLSYTRKRDQGREQRGELKAVSLRATEVCDLAADETVKIILKTKQTFVFAPIPISHDDLMGKQNIWILGSTALMDLVRLPVGTRTRPLSESERTFVQLDIKELKLMIAPAKPDGPR